MSKIPQKLSELSKFAGKSVEVQSLLLRQMPKDRTIIVGGLHAKAATDSYHVCYICGGSVWLDRRDKIALAGQILCPICPTCYLKLEPQPCE